MVFTRFKHRINTGETCIHPIQITYNGPEAFGLFCPEARFVEKDPFVVFSVDETLEKKEEIYKVTIAQDRITVSYRDARGAVNGAATVALLLRKESIETGEILDYPHCSYRSFMLDMARGLPSMESIKNALVCMGLAKMNHVHLHLMDDRGICYKSEALKGLSCKNGDQYEISEMQEIVAFCQKLAIKIIPEIEIPAHATELIRAFPELACDTDPAYYWTVCPGTDRLWPLFEKLIQEIAGIFPDEIIHIGSDELEFTDLKDSKYFGFWDSCSKCRALREREGLADRQAEFYYLINRIHAMVKACGKKMMMWNDQIDTTKPVPLDRDILIHLWRIAAPGRGPYIGCTYENFLKLGFETVNSDYPFTYCCEESYINLEKMAVWNPCHIDGIEEDEKRLVLGGEGCAWEFGNLDEYPQYQITSQCCIMIVGDKLWDIRDRTYTDNDKKLMEEYLFGKSFERDIFAPIGSMLPPRTKHVLTYAPNLPESEILACIDTLSKEDGTYNQRKFIEYYHRILSER